LSCSLSAPQGQELLCIECWQEPVCPWCLMC
jgi:hypothetical protein